MKLRELLEDLWAWRRGEHRIAPHGVRGRVYEHTGAPGDLPARTKGQAKMQMRVYRAEENAWWRLNSDTGKWEKEE